jgi:hypothetical protein
MIILIYIKKTDIILIYHVVSWIHGPQIVQPHVIDHLDSSQTANYSSQPLVRASVLSKDKRVFLAVSSFLNEDWWVALAWDLLINFRPCGAR